MRNGIASAATELASYGRGPDNMLAHISSDEARFIDHMQGGRRTNPHTGLPEYGLFGKILKGVARAAATIGGFMYGGPMGAAAANAAVTKLTGGSWKQAGIGALTSGLTAGLGNVVTGGMSNALSSGLSQTGAGLSGAASSAAPTGAAGMSMPMVGESGIAGSVGSAGIGSLPQVAIGAAPSALSQSLQFAKTLPGIGLGLASVGNLNGSGGGNNGAPPGFMPPTDNFRIPPSNMVPRQYIPYTGDPNKYGEGPEHLYFDNVNPIKFKKGGKTPKGISTASMAARAGTIKGAGDGKDDQIPAVLSKDEHVLDANLVSTLGNGSSDAGHAVIEKWKAKVRAKSGMKNPHKPSKKIDAMKLMPRV